MLRLFLPILQLHRGLCSMLRPLWSLRHGGRASLPA